MKIKIILMIVSDIMIRVILSIDINVEIYKCFWLNIVIINKNNSVFNINSKFILLIL